MNYFVGVDWRDGDFVNTAFEIRAEVAGEQTEQRPTAFQIEVAVELVEAIAGEIPIELFLEFGVRSYTCVTEIRDVLKVTFGIYGYFNRMVSSGFGAVCRVAEVQDGAVGYIVR